MARESKPGLLPQENALNTQQKNWKKSRDLIKKLGKLITPI